MRLVLDANQYISALINPKGLQRQILEMVYKKSLVVLLSPSIVEEIARVLHYPKLASVIPLGPQEKSDFLESLISVSEMVEGKLMVDAVLDDPDDNKYLACAIEGNAEILISGDQHLLKLGKYQGVSIMKARDFIECCGQES